MTKGIPVFMYHHVLPQDDFISIGKENFDKQMEYLVKSGYKTLSSEEFYLFKLGKFTPPKKAVFLTFDDGWRDFYYFAYPVLKRYGLRATVFLVTDWVEKASQRKTDFSPLSHKECKKLIKTEPERVILNWEEIEKMKDLCDFHSHSHTHFEESLPPEEEFELSRNILKKRLGINSLHFCWPRGEYNEKLLKIGQSKGYKIFYTTQRGTNLPDSHLLEIKRIAVKSNLFWLKKSLLIYSNSWLTKLYEKLRM